MHGYLYKDALADLFLRLLIRIILRRKLQKAIDDDDSLPTQETLHRVGYPLNLKEENISMKNRLATGSTSFTIDFSKRWV
jgi:hypothetical protein